MVCLFGDFDLIDKTIKDENEDDLSYIKSGNKNFRPVKNFTQREFQTEREFQIKYELKNQFLRSNESSLLYDKSAVQINFNLEMNIIKPETQYKNFQIDLDPNMKLKGDEMTGYIKQTKPVSKRLTSESKSNGNAFSATAKPENDVNTRSNNKSNIESKPDINTNWPIKNNYKAVTLPDSSKLSSASAKLSYVCSKLSYANTKLSSACTKPLNIKPAMASTSKSVTKLNSNTNTSSKSSSTTKPSPTSALFSSNNINPKSNANTAVISTSPNMMINKKIEIEMSESKSFFSKKFIEDIANSDQLFHDHKKRMLFKTEMCRSQVETGECKYRNSCQFAHHESELKHIERHPRYKTETCTTFWKEGTCPYGIRCCFIHVRDAQGNSVIGSKIEVEHYKNYIHNRENMDNDGNDSAHSEDQNYFNEVNRLEYNRIHNIPSDSGSEKNMLLNNLKALSFNKIEILPIKNLISNQSNELDQIDKLLEYQRKLTPEHLKRELIETSVQVNIKDYQKNRKIKEYKKLETNFKLEYPRTEDCVFEKLTEMFLEKISDAPLFIKTSGSNFIKMDVPYFHNESIYKAEKTEDWKNILERDQFVIWENSTSFHEPFTSKEAIEEIIKEEK
jgi:hypothetical protein